MEEKQFMATLNTRIIIRNDATGEWKKVENDVVLLKGEMGIEFPDEGTPKIKIGDGTTTWANLGYATKTPEEIDALLTSKIGEIPTDSDGKAVAKDIISYIQLKTDGIATDENLTLLSNRVTELEKIDHTHDNQEELDKIGEGDVAKWNTATDKINNLEIPTGSTVYQGTSLDNITADNNITKDDLNNGDFAIITSVINGDKKSRTAYVWDATIPRYKLNEDGSFKLDEETNEKIIDSYGDWVAFDGNYSADNIYFDDDMLVTTAIGYISLSSGSGTIPSKGKNLPEVFEAMFVKEQNPDAPTKPSITLTLNKAGSYEAGTELTGITYSASFNDGNYKYGPEPTGVTISVAEGKTELEMWTIKDSANNSYSKLSDSVTNPNITVVDGTNFYMTASVPYTQGSVPLTNKKNPCTDSSKRITAGTASKTSSAITCYRPWFYGYFDNDNITPENITSDQVRGLNLSNGTAQKTLPTTITTKAYKQIYFAIPRDKDGKTQKTVTAVANTSNDSPAGTVKHTVVYVKGAGGYAIDAAHATATNTVNGWAYDLYYISIPNANDGATWKVVTA
jgi:hypothetical protein